MKAKEQSKENRLSLATPVEHVGVAKLKSSLASYLARVRAGESFIITDRGIPIGKLSPTYVDPNDRELVYLMSKGLMMPPEGTLAEQERRWKEFFSEPPAFEDPDGFVLKGLLQERQEEDN